MNNFYASVECLHNPSLRGKPVAVGGDVEARHGIVLAKNYAAKAYGVKTGQALWEAKKLCPNLVFVPPHFEQYLKFSRLARDIYRGFTPNIESYGLDECWLDLTGCVPDFSAGVQAADKIRARVKFELGITCSVGVSFNKIFAKLGSDMKKPDATTVISRSQYRQIVWPLPVEDLLFVGPATKKKLYGRMIKTIGELAAQDVKYMEGMLGKNGRMLWAFANGLDTSPVAADGESAPVKSIGNSTTTPRDLKSDDEVKITLLVLSESVAERLREAKQKCATVQVHFRDNQLASYERQVSLPTPTCSAQTIYEAALSLYKRCHKGKNPLRTLGVRACSLLPDDAFSQLSLFPDTEAKRADLERTVDEIRRRFGHFAILRGLMLTDTSLSHLDPKGEHVIHPEPFGR